MEDLSIIGYYRRDIKVEKLFIITIDTESDNQWNSTNNQSTANAKFIPRFQELCEKYNFKPVYLVDYSMVNDSFLVEYLSECYNRGTCEIGMHLHAWDTPPFVNLDKCKDRRPYLIEYPLDIMEAKIATLDNALRSKFKCEIVSHRAGRWAMDDNYFMLLRKYGYKIDCSFTPGINWQGIKGANKGGTNYSHVPKEVHYEHNSGILEVPVTVSKIRYLKKVSLKELVKWGIGRNVWLRPALFDNQEMLKLVKKNKTNVCEFMMHSSEFMPGGSPYFSTESDIEDLFSKLDEFFSIMYKHYKGVTLKEFLNYLPSKEEDK